ncbi:hypothetical protein LTR86_004206 [Recurvomyces mirabilis]|nr:hypothetical protein LTR86_004206 [Recurvomyces mirabilis]
MAPELDSEAVFQTDEKRHEESPGSEEESDAHQEQLSTWRGTAILVSALTGTFLSILDSAIVAVALATIANEFGDFDESSWVFTGYMLSYMAFGVILARLSDTFGLATIETVSMGLFFAFSAAGASSRNMTELYDD